MVALPMYLSPITITAGVNDTIRCDDGNGGGAEDVTLAAGAHYVIGDGSATDLLAAIETALKTSASGSGWSVGLSAAGKVTCTNEDTTGTWQVLWGHANTTFDETLIGVAAGTTWSDTQDQVETADYWSAYRWTATKPVSLDTYDQGIAAAQQHVAPSRIVHTVAHGDEGDIRIIGHSHEPLRKAYETTSYEGQSWRGSFWPTARGGETIRYYPDASVPATYSSYVLSHENCTSAAPERHATLAHLYSWRVMLLGYVA